MAHRNILTEKQKTELIALPQEEALLRQHYILSNKDIIFLHQRNKSQNRLGFALQLCALRHPGR
jgi:TnpA family transposase